MKRPINLSFAFFLPVACALVLIVGCPKSSQQAKKSRDDKRKNDVARLDDTRPKQQEAKRQIGFSEPNKSKDASVSFSQHATVTDGQERQTEAASRTKLVLPKAIDWSIPAEKTAEAAEKVTGKATEKTTSDIGMTNDIGGESTVSSMSDQVTDQAVERDGTVNPFAIIESMQTPVAEAEHAIEVMSPTENVGGDDVIGEDVWEQGEEKNHESLENLEIKQPENNDAMQIFPFVPGSRNEMTDTVPDVIRNELRNKRQSENKDDIWEAVKTAGAEESNAVSTENSTENSTDSIWLGVQEDQVEEPVIISPEVGATTLPNVQNDDDLFGMGADAAAKQFGQTSDASKKSSTPSTQGDGLDTFDGTFDSAESFWDNTGDSDFGSLDNASDQETSGTPKPTEQARPQSQDSPSPATQPGTASGMQESDDDMILETMTKVDEYLVNEAKASPVKLMESAELLFKLNRPTLVKRLLRQFAGQSVTKEDCLQIHKRVNPAVMLRLSTDEKYQPEGARAVRKIIDGAKGYFDSRLEIEKAMQTLLSEATDRQKEDAMRILLNGRETAIEFLLERLKASDDSQELAETGGLLLALGDDARHALQESLMLPKLGMRAARLLTQMDRASDSRFLLPMMFDSRLTDADRSEVADMVRKLSRKVPTQEEAASIMYTMGTNYFREKVPFMTDENNNTEVWMLREGNEIPKFVVVSEVDASRYYAEKFSLYATCLNPTVAAYRQLWLVAKFDFIGADPVSSDNSILQLDTELLKKLKTGLSVADVESALRMAMQQDHPIAARVAAELMGEFDDVDEVLHRRGSQSVLVRAAGFSDRRVRFAALKSIMKLNPDRPYSGSSVVAQSLVFFTRATGKKRAVVVCPWAGEATTIANYLTPLGYTTETTTMGRQAMQLAIDSADTELMMLDVRTPNSDVGFLVQDMRADNRTHDVPIAIMANSDQMTRAERAAFGSKMALAFAKPYDEAAAKFVVDNLLRETGVEHVPPQVRLEEAKHSIRWVTELYQKPNLYRFENIEQIAYATIWEPELMAETLKLVELIPSATAQQMMTQIVSTEQFPIEIREAALKSFKNNAQAYGILIRGQGILNLYDLYNGSGGEPVASQQVRSSLLDVVEEYANYMQNVGYKK